MLSGAANAGLSGSETQRARKLARRASSHGAVETRPRALTSLPRSDGRLECEVFRLNRAGSLLRPILRMLASAVVLGAFASAGLTQPAPAPPARAQGAPKPPGGGGVLALLPASDSVTEHTIEIGGQRLAYTATAGTFTLFDANGERSAALFFTAYALKDAAPERRPVTFAFNGGPGASSAYLNLGLAGPRIADLASQRAGAAGARLRDNPDTWLRFTDLVFIDPVGTGWSRAAKPDGAGAFWNIGADASSLAKAIALYVAGHARGASPKYLLGESYGGFRAVKVARALQGEQGIVADGMVMVSPFLEGAMQFGGDRFALGAALQLPSLAAAELDRTGSFTPQALGEAERFAMTDYLTALAGAPPQGDAAARLYARIAALTGVPLEAVTRARGFVRDAAAKRAQEGRRELLSAYDLTFAAPDPFPETPGDEGGDPILDGYVQALGGLFAAYARTELGFATEMTFNLLNREVSGKWDWGHGRRPPSAMRDLREFLAFNPGARVLVAHGRSDAVTPYGVSRYLVEHLPPELSGPDRIAFKLYKGGHMLYLDGGTRAAFSADAGDWYVQGAER